MIKQYISSILFNINTWTLVTQKAWPDLPSPECTGPWGEIYTRHNPGAVLVTLASETVRSAREIIQNDTLQGLNRCNLRPPK